MTEMSPLRRRMIEDMTVRNLSPATQRSYVHAVAKFSRHFNRSPDRLGLEDVRAYQVHLVSKGISWPAPDLELFLGVEPPQLLLVHDEAFPRQQKMETPITEPPALPRQLPQPRSNLTVVRPPRPVAHRRTIRLQDRTRPPLAHPMGVTQVSDGLPHSCERHHFFAATSFNMALSSMASASSFFSRAFSASSTFSRLASNTSRPPYLAFHL